MKKLFYFMITCSLLLGMIIQPANASEIKDVSNVPTPNIAPEQPGSRQPNQTSVPDPDWKVAYHAETGKLRFLTSKTGESIAPLDGIDASKNPEAAAREFFSTYGELFGLSKNSDDLALMQVKSSGSRSYVRMQQQYQGVPVLGGEMVVQVDRDNQIEAVRGEASPGLELSVTPSLDSALAEAQAGALVSRKYEIGIDVLEISPAELWIFDPDLLGAPSMPGRYLAWRIQVTAEDLTPIRELVLLDAHSGRLLLSFNQIHASLNRVIYDNQNNPSYGLPGNGPVRVEGGAASPVTDVNNAYDYAGFTYDFFATRHGRDSLDDHGMTLASTVRYCPSALFCPYQNAFWNGAQMVYGNGFSSADDVVGHELTHGVTEHESNLLYYRQSGAINEAFSDIWGEFIDLSYTNGLDDDSPAVRWKMGEDIPGIGAIRDMSNPTLFGDPDRMGSPNYACGASDNGGVHTNSGVANKAAYLMVDGGSFNGYTINGIGIDKTAKIWYEVQTNLFTSGSDYQDLYDSLNLACNNLIGTGGITAANCAEVQKATSATEMNQQPAICAAPDAPLCSEPGFDTNFAINASEWKDQNVTWSMSSGSYTTVGIPGQIASISAENPFSDFDYTVRMQRIGGTNSASGIIVRGSPAPLAGNKEWHSGYRFSYTNGGSFAVHKIVNGTLISLNDWTPTGAIVQGGAWNTLHVRVEGDQLSFYINDQLVWQGVDLDYPSGQVGVFMYNGGDPLDRIYVDWANLNGGTPLNLFFDNMEDPLSGNWTVGVHQGSPRWYLPATLSSNGAPFTSSGEYSYFGEDPGSIHDFYVQQTNSVQLPTGKPIYLHFSHGFDFEVFNSLAVDGGVVEYNIGAGWTNASPLFVDNGPNATLYGGFGNPLGGQSGYGYGSFGLISSRASLTTLAGQNIRIRYRIGTDSSVAGLGWFVDDVRIYTCEDSVQNISLPMVMNSTSSPPDVSSFHTAFTGSAPRWIFDTPDWTVGNHYLASEGTPDKYSSVSYDQDYDNLDITVRLRRNGCESCENSVIVRGSPTLNTANEWAEGYVFSIRSSGQYAVSKRVGGVTTQLKTWTMSGAIVKDYPYWNLLRVVADGTSLKFYINGTLVWQGTDGSLSTGKLGLQMYRSPTSGWDQLLVDWVTVLAIP